jgi:hypothetical protein
MCAGTASEGSLAKLDEMGIGEAAVLRVAEMILDGLVRTPESANDGPVVAAARELLHVRPAGTVEELAARIECVYSQHERFMKLRRQLWLEMLERLAGAKLDVPPESLESKLKSHIDAQWVVVDCLGLPLAATVRTVLSRCMPQRQLRSVEFALVSQKTSTEAFYLTLIGQEFKKTFEKIDAVDQMVHQRNLSLPELARLAAAELEIAFKRLIPRLDSTRPVLVFGDHGFRLAADGSGFTHGGPSTLERLTVAFLLDR